MVDWGTNAQQLGRNILFALMWVATYGIVEYIMNMTTQDVNKRLLLYVLMFIVFATLMLYVGFS